MGFDALFTGISGLNAYQDQIDMISNNIANVGTIGFKGQRMTFADMFYQSQGFASAPTQSNGGVNPMQVGIGVKTNTIDTNFSQGGLETTGINTDLAINGDGFFMLRNLDGSGSPIYTRDGAFSLNSNGVLYDPASGLAVQGYMANANGTVTATGAPGTITVPLGLQMQAAGTGGANATKIGMNNAFDMTLGGQLDQTQFAAEVANPGTGVPKTITTTIYDSLGNAHQATITFSPDATGSSPASETTTDTAAPNNNLSGSVTVASTTSQSNTITISPAAGGTYSITDGTNTITGSAGQKITMDGATFTLNSTVPPVGSGSATINITGAVTGLPATVKDSNGDAIAPGTRWKYTVAFTDGTNTTAGDSSGYVWFDGNGQFINTSGDVNGTNVFTGGTPSASGTTGTGAGNAIEIDGWPAGDASAQPATIALDFSKMSALSGTATANVINQDGYSAGTLSNIVVGQDGSVMGSFTNGQQKIVAQLALATFQNEDGLQRIGGNGFEATANSGLAQVGLANSGRYGAIQSGALEQSNVSLANEFTKMIVAQRAFEANTRGITTADQNMMTVLNMRASEN